MSTLIMSQENIAPSAAVAPPSPGFFTQLIRSREVRANLRVMSYLMWQSDERLATLGFSVDDIRDLREGKQRFPVAR